ncbi:MAG: 16S rRNA pseudouridine(516) synthase, partial [Acetobacteraceae bacterium]
MRLDRFLSNLERFNRKQVRLALIAGRIQVDGRVVRDPLHAVTEFSEVRLDEELLQAGHPARYLMLH